MSLGLPILPSAEAAAPHCLSERRVSQWAVCWRLQAQALVWLLRFKAEPKADIVAPTQVSAALRQAGELFVRTYDRVFPASEPRQPAP